MVEPSSTLSNDELLTAGQLALGTLEGDELSGARRMQLYSADFANAVEWWNMKLGAMAEAAGELPLSTDLLPAINAEIDRISSSSEVIESIETVARPSPWSIGFAVTGLASAAAALTLFLSTPQSVRQEGPPDTGISAVQLVAQLSDEETGRRIAGIIDSDTRRLAITAIGLDAGPGRTAELWVIPAGGAPRSLGNLPANGNLSRELSAIEAALLVEGSSLAVTFEEDTGLPHSEPTMPILLVGALDRV